MHGLSNANIRAVTGHKNNESVERYKRVATDENLKTVSAILGQAMCSTSADIPSSSASGVLPKQPSFTLELDLEEPQKRVEKVKLNGSELRMEDVSLSSSFMRTFLSGCTVNNVIFNLK